MIPDIGAIKIAFVNRLYTDATLMTLVEGIWDGRVPSDMPWAKPNLTYTIQADTDDPANGYGQDGVFLVFNLMCHDRGADADSGSFDACYTALLRAHTVLTASPLTVSGQTIWRLRRSGGIPQMEPPDDSGYRRFQVGALYEVRAI